jgi:hypothetical protein
VQADLESGRQYYILASETGGAFGVGADLVALGSATPERQNVRAWLASYRRTEPAAGMLESMDQVQRRTWESVARRGLSGLQGYSSRDLAIHSLKGQDGDPIEISASVDATAAAASAPMSSVGAVTPAACPRGQVANADTANHCCWPAQAWSVTRSACVGLPQCPAGFQSTGQGCGEAGCPAGETITADTQGHCCWPGQAWAPLRAACVGVPSCPSPLRPTQDSCIN